MAGNYNEDISNNLDEIRRVLELILAEMRRRNDREEQHLLAEQYSRDKRGERA